MTRSYLLLVFALVLGSSEFVADYFSGYDFVSISIEFESNENTETETKELADEDYLIGEAYSSEASSTASSRLKKHFYHEPILPSFEIPPEA